MIDGTFSTRVTELSGLSSLRAALARSASEQGASSDTIHTVELVASELCTNALHHGRAPDVVVELKFVDGSWHLTTRHRDEHPENIPSVTALPGIDSLRGRGLAIVDRLVDDCSLQVDGQVVIRRCSWVDDR